MSVLLWVLLLPEADVTAVTFDDVPEEPLEEAPRGNSNAKIFVIDAASRTAQIENQIEIKSGSDSKLDRDRS